MECDISGARRDVFIASGRAAPRIGQFCGRRALRVVRRACLPGAPAVPLPGAACPPHPCDPLLFDDPFMSAMDEISYWIHTKRAPCLMNYDNPIKRNRSHSSKEPCGITEDAHSPNKKQKRKLSLLDDDSYMEQHQNVYFESHKKPPVNNHKSGTSGSDVDFDLKNTSVVDKSKQVKLHKSRTIHKKNKVVTSTPQSTAHLRRSLRHNKGVKHHLDSSFEIFNTSLAVTNGAHTNDVSANKSNNKIKAPELQGGGDQTIDNKRNSNNRNKTKTTLNGQFDDMSDVSGFTANYIRSTKMQSNKTPRKIRCQSSRALVKEPQIDNETNLVITVNKSVNTGVHNILNCSTDSSQNLINLVTTKNNDKSVKVDKSTSLLKFLDSKGKHKVVNRKSRTKLNITYQSQSSGTTRYPKRNRTTVTPDVPHVTRSPEGTRTNKNCMDFNHSDKKENPQDKFVSKTRSGRNIGMQREHSVLVVSNSTDPVSSMVSLNVASPNLGQLSKKRRTPIRQRAKKSTDKVQSPRKRDRSGFTACFSESDGDSEPLVQRKYFCA